MEIAADGRLSPWHDPAGESSLGREALFHPQTRRLPVCCGGATRTFTTTLTAELQEIAATTSQIMSPASLVHTVNYAEDSRLSLVYTESDNSAGSYHVLDLVEGSVQKIGDNYPDLPAAWIAAKTSIHYPAADGLPIQAYLTLPPFRATGQLPAIVLPHGGPEAAIIPASIGWPRLWRRAAMRCCNRISGAHRGLRSTSLPRPMVNGAARCRLTSRTGCDTWRPRGSSMPSASRLSAPHMAEYAALAGATIDVGVYRCAVSIAGVSDLGRMIEMETNDTDNARSSTVLYWKTLDG